MAVPCYPSLSSLSSFPIIYTSSRRHLHYYYFTLTPTDETARSAHTHFPTYPQFHAFTPASHSPSFHRRSPPLPPASPLYQLINKLRDYVKCSLSFLSYFFLFTELICCSLWSGCEQEKNGGEEEKEDLMMMMMIMLEEKEWWGEIRVVWSYRNGGCVVLLGLRKWGTIGGNECTVSRWKMSWWGVRCFM